MPRKFFRRFLPDHREVREHRLLKVFGSLLHDPNLWHLNRRSVAGGVAVGFFCAFVPVPSQMLLAAAVAIVARVNLPLAMTATFITNPVTMAPMFFLAYKLGAALLGLPHRPFHFEMSLHWLGSELAAIWAPFLLGCLVLGTLSGAAGYLTVRGLWRLHVVRYWHARRRRQRRDGPNRLGPTD
jgi:uncharacterized protein (DUF2062 family)